MTPCVTVAGENDAAAWDDFVGRRASTGYHVWKWRSVFRQAFGHSSTYLAARVNERIVGVLPLVQINSLVFGRSLTSLPFVTYGGIVAESEVARDALLESAAALAHACRCTHVELRHVERQIPRLPCKEHKVAMRLPLQREMWSALDRKVRNQIRKAQKSGFTSAEGGIEQLDDFYRVFARNMRDLGTPVYGRRFFAVVLNTFPDRTRVHVVRLNGVPVAAGITYRSGNTIEVPWASSIRDYNSLCPNHLFYWNVLAKAAEDGCEVLDFGRSTPNEGTYKFKAQWGAIATPLHWEYWLRNGARLPNASPTNPKYQWAIQVWRKLPLPIATSLGPSIVRAIP